MRCSPLAGNRLWALSTDFGSGIGRKVIRCRCQWIWLVLLMASLAHAAPSPEVVVIVFSVPSVSDTVSVAYRVPVEDETVRQDLRVIAQRGGWTVKKLSVTQKDGTGARLETSGVVNPAAPTLPVAPFIEAFKRFRRLRIMFVVNSASTQFMPDQPPVSENQHIKLTFSHRTNTYTFDVEILNSDFESITLPTAAVPPPSAAETQTAPASSGWGWWAMAFILVAGMAGSAIWRLCGRPHGQKAARRMKWDALSKNKTIR